MPFEYPAPTLPAHHNATNPADYDPRDAPDGTPIGYPDPGDRYPTEGLPYPDPDAIRALSLDPPTAVVGAPDFTIRVLGQGFDEGSTILWNGSVEPTTFVSPTEVTTGVNMATVSGPASVPVAVRNSAGRQSNPLPFEFTAAAPEEPEADAPARSASRTGQTSGKPTRVHR
jgi:hypothetical protein